MGRGGTSSTIAPPGCHSWSRFGGLMSGDSYQSAGWSVGVVSSCSYCAPPSGWILQLRWFRSPRPPTYRSAREEVVISATANTALSGRGCAELPQRQTCSQFQVSGLSFLLPHNVVLLSSFTTIGTYALGNASAWAVQ